MSYILCANATKTLLFSHLYSHVFPLLSLLQIFFLNPLYYVHFYTISRYLVEKGSAVNGPEKLNNLSQVKQD